MKIMEGYKKVLQLIEKYFHQYKSIYLFMDILQKELLKIGFNEVGYTLINNNIIRIVVDDWQLFAIIYNRDGIVLDVDDIFIYEGKEYNYIEPKIENPTEVGIKKCIEPLLHKEYDFAEEAIYKLTEILKDNFIDVSVETPEPSIVKVKINKKLEIYFQIDDDGRKFSISYLGEYYKEEKKDDPEQSKFDEAVDEDDELEDTEYDNHNNYINKTYGTDDIIHILDTYINSISRMSRHLYEHRYSAEAHVHMQEQLKKMKYIITDMFKTTDQYIEYNPNEKY